MSDNRTDLAARRIVCMAELRDLQSAQAVAILDGKTFDASPIIVKQAEIDAIDLAAVEAARRERVALQVRVEAAKIAAMSGEPRELLDAFEAAATAADEASNMLVAALRAMESLGPDLASHIRTARGSNRATPDVLTPNGSRRLLSRLLAGKLSGLGRMSEYGDIEWSGVPLADGFSATIGKLVIARVVEALTDTTPAPDPMRHLDAKYRGQAA